MGNDEETSSTSDSDRSSSLSELADRLSGGSGEVDNAGETGGSQSLSELAESLERRSDSEPTLDDEDLGEWDFVAQGEESGRESALDPKTEALLELTGGASNVLLNGPSDCPAEQGLCSRLMESRSEERVNLLVITITDTPSQRLSVLENYLNGPVGETAVVDVRNYNREVSYDEYDGPVTVRSVSNTQDLRRIGIVTSKILTEWEETSGQTTMCFHSLSDLLSLNDDHERVFRFLHVLRGRVQSAGVRAHYHFDPQQHDDQTVRTFQSLFDTVLQFDDDGSVSLL